MRELCGFMRYGFLNYKLKPIVSSCVLINSCRNTYILKRTFDPILSKESAGRFRRLRPRHFLYEEVQDTKQVVSPDVHVVLTTFVDGVGDTGDVISVDPYFARENLLLTGKAVYATPENIEHYGKMENKPEKPKHSSIYAGLTIRYLQSIVVPVQMNPEQPWTVEPWHIRVAYRKEGIIVPQNAIKLPESAISGPDPAKEGKDFAVFLTINNTETFPARCRLFHFKMGLETVRLRDECYKGKASPILEEQEELLNSMPVPKLDDGSESYVTLKEKYRITLLQ